MAQVVLNMSLLDDSEHSLHICMTWQQAANVFLSLESFKCCYLPLACNASHSQTVHDVQTSEHLHSSNPAFDWCDCICHFIGTESHKLHRIVTWKDLARKQKRNKKQSSLSLAQSIRNLLSFTVLGWHQATVEKTRLESEYYCSWKYHFITLMSALIIIITLSLH